MIFFLQPNSHFWLMALTSVSNNKPKSFQPYNRQPNILIFRRDKQKIKNSIEVKNVSFEFIQCHQKNNTRCHNHDLKELFLNIFFGGGIFWYTATGETLTLKLQSSSEASKSAIVKFIFFLNDLDLTYFFFIWYTIQPLFCFLSICSIRWYIFSGNAFRPTIWKPL